LIGTCWPSRSRIAAIRSGWIGSAVAGSRGMLQARALAGNAASGCSPQVGFKSDKREPKGAARLRPRALDRADL
jgi:hypothetical protein